MSEELIILSYTAITIGFLHALLGPDHYIPFIVMSKAGKWSKRKTIWITAVSGLGHVLGSIIIGAIGLTIGVALNIVEEIEAYRGTIAGWALISFGVIYFIWAVKNLIKNKSHIHSHTHSDGITHSHNHNHRHDHTHIHESKNSSTLTPWILFTIFVLGPCEALIPLLIYPAANISISGILIVILLFGVTTILTMLGMVLISLHGFSYLPLSKFEKYSHVLAGFIVILSGFSIQVIGL